LERRKLDRNEKSRILFICLCLFGPRAKKSRLIVCVLLDLIGKNGRLDPSHETIAKHAGCNERTVRRALKALRGQGIIDWINRAVQTARGRMQTSNAYFFRRSGEMSAYKDQIESDLNSSDISATGPTPRITEAEHAALRLKWFGVAAAG